MLQLSKQTKKTWLSYPETPSGIASPSAYIRCTLTVVVKNLLQQSGNSATSDTTPNQEPLLNIGEFFKSIQTSNQVYKASFSRQLSADSTTNFELTSLKDEPKDWFIKTADYGDECDRVLQHRDGEFTQLLEDVARYQQKFKEGYDKIILLRSPIYTGYDIQLTAAMQALGYTKEQFQFIIVQPIKLYAFHIPTQQVHPIPDLAPEELIKAIGIDALRWHSLRVPLTSSAPINISTAGQPTPADSLYRVQSAHARCCTLLHQAHQQGMIKLDMRSRDNWQISSSLAPVAKHYWNSSQAKTLVSQLQAVPEILQRSAAEIAPHLVCQHLEAIGNSCHQWCDSLVPTHQDCALLLATKQTLFDLLENILSITAPDSRERS
jgi:arginyl-tRNA synthetase